MMFHNFAKPWEHREEGEGESRRRRRRLFRERSRNGMESRMRTQRELEDELGGLSEEQNLVMVMMVVRMAVIVNWVVRFHIRISFDLERAEKPEGQSNKLGIGQQRDIKNVF